MEILIKIKRTQMLALDVCQQLVAYKCSTRVHMHIYTAIHARKFANVLFIYIKFSNQGLLQS